MQLLLTLNLSLSLLLLSAMLEAAILPLNNNISNELPTSTEKLGYVELRPNGTLILRSATDGHDNGQNLLLLRSVLNALKLAALTRRPGEPRLDIKIYGDGVEHKFPPLLENIIQRIQTYFSIYRYTDTSRPLRQDELELEVELATEATTVRVSDNIDTIVVGSENKTAVEVAT